MSDRKLGTLVSQLSKSLSADAIVQNTVKRLRQQLDVDRIAIYYFYRRWKGQVTFEALARPELSILGSTGADDCFNDDYAERYLNGRNRAIDDIETADIHPCHKEFLESIQVRANLVVPVLREGDLWGLLVAHHSTPRTWSEDDFETMREAANTLEGAAAIRER